MAGRSTLSALSHWMRRRRHTSSTWKSPPVAGIRAISPICVPNVERSSCPNCRIVSLGIMDVGGGFVRMRLAASSDIVCSLRSFGQLVCIAQRSKQSPHVIATRGRLIGASCVDAISISSCFEVKVSQHRDERMRQAEVALSIGCVIGFRLSSDLGLESSEVHLVYSQGLTFW